MTETIILFTCPHKEIRDHAALQQMSAFVVKKALMSFSAREHPPQDEVDDAAHVTKMLRIMNLASKSFWDIDLTLSEINAEQAADLYSTSRLVEWWWTLSEHIWKTITISSWWANRHLAMFCWSSVYLSAYWHSPQCSRGVVETNHYLLAYISSVPIRR